MTRLVAASLAAAVVLAPAPTLAVCPSNGLFLSPTFYEAGVFPVTPTAGDFNADGKIDIAVANYTSGTVSVFLGKGDGTFLAGTQFAAGRQPRGVVAADLDGDGILDLAVTNVDSTVTILRGLGSAGHGNGSFGPPVSYPSLGENRGVVAADLNGDGHLDLVVAGRSAVAILLNAQSSGVWGAFPSSTLYPTHSSWGVAVGDFNGDGIPDVAAGNLLDPSVPILLGNGNGTFHAGATVAVPAGCADITAADLDGDGIPDLVVSSFNGLEILKGNGSSGHGDGTFSVSTAASFGHQFNSAVVADFNGDGLLDIVATDPNGPTAVFVPGDGTGGFGPYATYPMGSGPNGIVSFDANADGHADVFVVCSGDNVYDGSIAALMGACIDNHPRLAAVKDVPHDQGGKVFLFWQRSDQDDPVDQLITDYRVWRRNLVPPGAARVAPDLASFDPSRHSGVLEVAARPNGARDVTYWELLTSVPAAYLDGYSYTASTTQDSLPGSNPYTAFFIQALAGNPGVFFNSAVDSGYSVDNLAPPTPVPFAATYGGGANTLHWVRSRAPDFVEFRLYRGASPDFTPSPSNLLVATRDTTFQDAAGSVTYKLAAVDLHGNASPYAAVSPEQPVATLASLVGADASANRISLVWYAGGRSSAMATVYRRTAVSDWTALASVAFDGSGFARYDDVAVTSGTRYDYRLGIIDAGAESFTDDTWVLAVTPELALLGATPNPLRGGSLSVGFILPSSAAARLELIDVSGRRVTARDVGALGAGRHVVDLSSGARIPPGVYLVRLTRGNKTLLKRIVYLE